MKIIIALIFVTLAGIFIIKRICVKGIFRCGPLKIKDLNKEIFLAGIQSAHTKSDSSAIVKLYEITGERLNIVLGYFICENDEEDVRTVEIIEGSESLRTLEGKQKYGDGRLRMGIYSLNDHENFAELRQARIRPDAENVHSNAYKADEIELSNGAGTDCRKCLRRTGAISFGLKKEILNESLAKDRETYMCVTFNKDNYLTPVVAYVLSRILPLKYNIINIK